MPGCLSFKIDGNESNEMSMDRFDLIIAGAGPTGAALACALAPWFKRIAIVDAQPPYTDDDGRTDPRTLALANTSARILAGLGVWRQISALANPICDVRLFAAGAATETRMDGHDQHFGALGFTVSAHALTTILHERLRATAIQWYAPHRIKGVAIEDEGARVALDDGDTLRGRLLVAADGSRSLIREALGIVSRDTDYHQQAVLAELVTATPAKQTAFEVLTAGGPLALLPNYGRWSMVWVQGQAEAEALMTLNNAALIARIQEQLGGRVEITQVANRYHYPLHQVQAWTLTGERTALLGNAAHTVHPVGAQGLNLGLRDVATLAELLVQAVRAGVDPGDPGLLDQYARRRSADHYRVLAVTDSLAHLLGESTHPLRPWLGTGLNLLRALPPLQRGLIRLGVGGFDATTRLGRGLPL